MEESFRVLSEDDPDEDLALLAAQLGRFHFFRGDSDLSIARVERALDIAEALGLPEILSQALNTKAVIINAKGRRREGLALMRYALEVALENDISSAALRAYYNLADLAMQGDRHREAAELVASGQDLAGRVGNRLWGWYLNGQLFAFACLAEWDTAISMISELPIEKFSEARGAFGGSQAVTPFIRVQRGEVGEARKLLETFSELADSADIQERLAHATGTAIVLRADGKHGEALASAQSVVAARDEIGLGSELVKMAFGEAVEAAFALGDLAEVEELLATIDDIPTGRIPPYFRAQSMRFRARLADARGETDAPEGGFKGAAGMFRELEMPFWLAVTMLEHGEWLGEQGRVDEAQPLLEEARGTFERLQAKPWLDRLNQQAQVKAELSG